MMHHFQAEYESRRAGWSDIQDHMPYLYQVARKPRAQILELGVRTGQSTAAFLAGLDGSSGGHLWSVDINPPEVPDWWHESPLWTFTLSGDLQYTHHGPPLDVLFIDTSHYYQHTLEELRRFVPRVRSGGLVLCHDTEVEAIGTTQQIPFPVARALDAYCAEQGQWQWENRRGSFGLGVMVIP